MTAIVWPEEHNAHAADLGGKGRSLVELAKVEGVKVPPWFAVPAAGFAAAAASVDDGIRAALTRLAGGEATPVAIASCLAELEPLLAHLETSPALRAELAAAYARLGGGFVAVRSSALDEDGADASFAGQLDTSLFVREPELAAAVASCWRSAFSERSLVYRAQKGALLRPIKVAVIIQRMIDGEVSGVLFTADPSTGDRARLIAASTWGLGEGVVSGRCATDTFTLVREADGIAVVERDISDKNTVVRHDRERGGTAEVDVAADQRNAPSLDDDRLRALARAGIAIEAHYGFPVDVEWTFADGALWLLQARPITTLPPAAQAQRGRSRLWDNSNIIESYNGVTTPMTYSFARRAYAMVYRQAFELLGVPRRDLEANTGTFEQMIGLLGGRVYYNLESWYAVLQLLPGYKLNSEFMEQMMGVREAARFGHAPAQRSPVEKWLVDLPELITSLTSLAYRFTRSQELVDGFFRHFGESYGDFWERDLEHQVLDELVDTYLEAERRIMGQWQAPIVNDILAMIFFGALRKSLGAWGLGDSSLHNDLLCGEGGLESTEPTRDLLDLAQSIRKDPALVAAFGQKAPAIRAQVAVDPRFGWLKVRLAAHVDRFGDRCIDELKLEQPTLRDDETFLYSALKGYLSAAPVTVEEMDAREKTIRAAAEKSVGESLRGLPFAKRLVARRAFPFLLAGARRHVKNRENLRFARTRAFGLVRRIVVEMGKRLVDAARIDQQTDVFYLEINEIIAFVRGTATTTDLRGLITVRKAEFASHRAAAALGERFWTQGATYLDPAVKAVAPVHVEAAGAGAVLQGVAAAPGVVRAPARVVHDPRGVEMDGGVLVANRTDPGWVPLFPSARAVVVERGSVLSHSAIVAREFGIPCVVGVRDALSLLRDGQLIEVDGGIGRITTID